MSTQDIDKTVDKKQNIWCVVSYDFHIKSIENFRNKKIDNTNAVVD